MKAVVVLLCTTLAAVPAAVVNNSGFENVNERTGLPSGWGYTSLPGQSDLVQYKVTSMSDAKNDKALAITVSKNHPEQRVAYNVFQDIPGIQNGKTYQVSARVQTRGLETMPMVVVQCIDQSGKNFVGFARTPERQLQQDIKEWESVETKVTVPEGTARFLIRAGIPSQGNAGGTAILDDITVTEVENTPAK
ncbi:MAG: hypothetical protein ABIK07_11380 [Planctomycetota bacterium]